MEFGIAFKGDLEHKRTLASARQVEAGGFDYIWFFDSHIIWSDPYSQIAASMQHTERVRYGPLVTNPKVRDWSVAASVFGSVFMGIVFDLQGSYSFSIWVLVGLTLLLLPLPLLMGSPSKLRARASLPSAA